MAGTNSLSFPNMFDVTHNQVSVIDDSASVSNRVRLLILTEPTELYNNLDFGVGLKRYLWTYKTENQKAIIQDRITQQIKKYEPCVDPDSIQFSDGLLITGSEDTLSKTRDHNQLKMTLRLVTKFKDELVVNLNEYYESLQKLSYTLTSNGVKSYLTDD